MKSTDNLILELEVITKMGLNGCENDCCRFGVFSQSMFFALFFAGVLTISLVCATNPITSNVPSAEDCDYRWVCSEWVPEMCPESGIQTRTCTNAGDCSNDYNHPVEVRGCENVNSENFSIQLELPSSYFSSAEDVDVWILFENLEGEQKILDLSYLILNSKGESVYAKESAVVVDTEKFIVERFNDLRLNHGEYRLVLKVANEGELLREIGVDFEIRNENSFLIIISVILLFLISIFLGIKIFRGCTCPKK